MKQVVQAVSGGGELRVVDVPRPFPGPTEVLVKTTRSVLSPGTERAVRSLASSSLLQKARARPDLVRQVMAKARAEGLATTMRAVRARLDEEMPLGYCGMGTVAALGEAAPGLAIGQRVVTASAGHAEYQVVPAHLAVPVPDEVDDAEAAFATIAAIALHGFRLAEVGPGGRVVVIGLGLVGQLAMRLAQASGCEVAGIDLKPDAVALAAANGGLGLVESGADTTEAVRQWTGGHGADAVLLTAATSSSEPVRRAAALARDRAIVVVVGDVGLDMQRTPYYEKELNLRFARSYGPGRYERTYEDWGVDYPIGAVRWTEGRNLEAYLSLLRSGRLSTADLITHEFPFERVLDAYEVVEQGEDALGVHLIYQQSDEASATVVDIAPRKRSGDGVGLIGAGSYARATLVPAIGEAGWQDLAVVASEGGLSARLLAERGGFARAASSADDVFTDDSVNVVFIATRHDSHAALTLRALQAGKHVFCEKPLAITEDELNAVIDAWRSSPGQLAVGFNRRWSPAVKAVREHFTSGSGPLLMTYRVAAGRLDASHWYHDRRQGGRLLGEVCHFIDTCNAIAEADVTSVIAIGAGGLEALLQEDLSLLIRYADGSQAAIVYATGASPGTPKERLEVLGRDRTAVIDDFRRTTLDGKTTKGDGQDKGHVELLRQFKAATERTELAAALTVPALETSAVALAAAESLLTGNAVRPVPVPGSR